jgi:hypothetical protein
MIGHRVEVAGHETPQVFLQMDLADAVKVDDVLRALGGPLESHLPETYRQFCRSLRSATMDAAELAADWEDGS